MTNPKNQKIIIISILFLLFLYFLYDTINYPSVNGYNPITTIRNLSLPKDATADEKLTVIINQNRLFLDIYAFIFLLIVSFISQKRLNPEIKLRDLWDTDQIDKLLELTDDKLNKSPNDEAALYFRGKALFKTEKYEAALYCFKRLRSINPAFTEAGKYITDIEKKLNPITH